MRKPLSVAAFLLDAFCVVWSVVTATDIPENALKILIYLTLVTIGGYFGTSAWETVARQKAESLIKEVEGCEETGK